MKLVTVHVKPPIPSRELDWSAYDADADLCFEPTCGCRTKFAQGTGATEEAAIISFVQDLLWKRNIEMPEEKDIYWCCSADFGKHELTCRNYREEPCGNAGSTKES